MPKKTIHPHRCIIRTVAMLLVLSLFMIPAMSQVTIENKEHNISTTIAAWMQPRYDFFEPDGGEAISRFSIRRVLLDIRGHAFTEKFTYRITPEYSDLDLAHARNVYPILLHINYAFSPEAQIMFGQIAVPFHWHFFVPLPGLYFYERSLASADFGTFGGWDKGVMFHGNTQLGEQPFRYAFAVIDGEGFNRRKNRNTGHTFSAQAVYAPLGTMPAGESDFRRSEDPQLTIGLGLQYGMDSEARNWTLGRSPNNRADFLTGTVFTRFAYLGFSLIGEGFYRNVMPEAAAVDNFNGNAYTIAAGYMILPDRVEFIARYTGLNYDTDLTNGDSSELGVGFNFYFRGHNAQLRTQYQKIEHGIAVPGSSFDQFVIEAQVHFF